MLLDQLVKLDLPGGLDLLVLLDRLVLQGQLVLLVLLGQLDGLGQVLLDRLVLQVLLVLLGVLVHKDFKVQQGPRDGLDQLDLLDQLGQLDGLGPQVRPDRLDIQDPLDIQVLLVKLVLQETLAQLGGLVR